MLYHISEESDIAQFSPRPPAAYPGMSPVVWALDEAHLVNYLFPRECPRVIYALSDGVSDGDQERFFLLYDCKGHYCNRKRLVREN
ncbi:DUF6886 family protein [Paenibacillus gorillae]|uniref:DUF6886 family protein n=1 Tax=Paenibacillus gorillae TaxID=1243662 RepID=UPI00307B4720